MTSATRKPAKGKGRLGKQQGRQEETSSAREAIAWPQETPAAEGAQGPKLSLADKATLILRRAIVELRIEPNARLDERYLQEEFSISRTPAREALNRLLAEGFLEARAGFGVCARALDLSEINGFFDAYFAEEKMIAHFCQFDDAGFVNDMLKIDQLHYLAQGRSDVPGVNHFNREFHVRIAKACRNFHILKFAEQMHDHAQRLTSLIYRIEGRMQCDPQSEQTKVDGFHKSIIDCIQRGAREDLTRTMTAHAKQFHDRVCSAITFNRGAFFEL